MRKILPFIGQQHKTSFLCLASLQAILYLWISAKKEQKFYFLTVTLFLLAYVNWVRSYLFQRSKRDKIYKKTLVGAALPWHLAIYLQ